MRPRPPRSTLFPYTTLFRSSGVYRPRMRSQWRHAKKLESSALAAVQETLGALRLVKAFRQRSEEHTSELQSLRHLVCRLLLEKKNKQIDTDDVLRVAIGRDD